MRFKLAILAAMLVAGCVTPATEPSPQAVASAGPTLSPEVAQRNFTAVVARVEPVAEAECQARRPNKDCDFTIVVDPDQSQPANAYQSLDPDGGPRITFTMALIADARNSDELAFILGHEAAHHIRSHIPKTQRNATAGAVLLGGLAAVVGAGAEGVDQAAQLGAGLGALRFSKDMELEADVLGTVIAHRAGYDPERGAQYFARIPSPGDSFLSSHPPNDQRQQAVSRTADRL